MTIKKVIFYYIFLIVIIGIIFNIVYPNLQSFGKKRERIINDMNKIIDKEVDEGNYRCCIEPACTMCFMGDWIWDDGICRCDDMIINKDNESICPQCKRGLEEGRCKYSEVGICEI